MERARGARRPTVMTVSARYGAGAVELVPALTPVEER